MAPVSSIWIIGMAMAGKTVLGRLAVDWLRGLGHQSILIDGAEVRALNEVQLGFDARSRRRQTAQVMRIARWAAQQQLLPVITIIHPFEDDRQRCRTEITGYYEVFLECDMQELIRRDSKKLYLPAIRGTKRHVVGIDIPYDPPLHSDLVIATDRLSVEESLGALQKALADRLPPKDTDCTKT